MQFKEFKQLQQKHVEQMLEGQTHLFTVDIDNDTLWNTYLDSFPEGSNEIYRERSEYDCSCCRHFIRNFNVVAIKDNTVITIWDFETGSNVFQPVVNTMSNLVKSCAVSDVFVTDVAKFGTDTNHEQLEDGSIQTWNHFYVELPKRFVTKSNKSIPSLVGSLRDTRNVFKRSLDEISQDSVETVLELIAQKSLYKGEEWEDVLKQFLKLHKEYNNLQEDEQENYAWVKSVEVGAVVGRIRNHSIGVLLQDIASGMELNEAVKRYESIVAPSNYKRPKAIFTKRMLQQAQEKVVELGLMDSLGRRLAVLDDITVNNILFTNRSTEAKMTGNPFHELATEVQTKHKNFDKVEEVTVDDFVANILPTAKSVELYLENKHESNLVSLIAPQIKNSKSLFKWDNGFSWAYNGNVADSMKERVKAAGGRVDGVLRFSLQWNENSDNHNDFDAHCVEPSGNHIYFGNKYSGNGKLDVDIINPRGVAVENITWQTERQVLPGIYRIYINNYSHRGGRSGFSAELEYNGTIYEYEYREDFRNNMGVVRFEITKDKELRIIDSLPSTQSTKQIWNINTNDFHPVNVVMYSPNYWDEQQGIGNKHYIFMLKGCINDTTPNGFFNEYLRQDFMEHKRVFEALGSKMKVQESDNQLSGLGFSSTQRNEIICKVEGSFTRVIKIKF